MRISADRASDAGRLPELDALRGLAACAVVVNHLLDTLPEFGSRPYAGPRSWLGFLAYGTPLGTLIDGHAAVLLFFVLSGLVLGRALSGPRRPAYGAFLAKRAARLYPPYAAALLVAAFLQAACAGHALPHASRWLVANWTDHATWRTAADYALMLGGTVALDNPVWSLDYEMRISALFPVLIALGRGAAWRMPALAASLLAAGLVAPVPLLHHMLTYAGMFALGAALGRHAAALRRLPRWAGWVLPVVGCTLIWSTWREAVQSAGAAALIAASLAPGPVSALCRMAAPRFLGRISYSLYLIHVPVLLALTCLIGLPLARLLLIPAALGAAWLMFAAVEAPSHALARRLGRRNPA